MNKHPTRGPRKSSISPRANVNPLKMERFESAFRGVANHFMLSQQERDMAYKVALEDYAHATECYMAIARTL